MLWNVSESCFVEFTFHILQEEDTLQEELQEYYKTLHILQEEGKKQRKQKQEDEIILGELVKD